MVYDGSGRFIWFFIFACLFSYIGLTLQARDRIKDQLSDAVEQRKITAEEYDRMVDQIDFMSVALRPEIVFNFE